MRNHSTEIPTAMMMTESGSSRRRVAIVGLVGALFGLVVAGAARVATAQTPDPYDPMPSQIIFDSLDGYFCGLLLNPICRRRLS